MTSARAAVKREDGLIEFQTGLHRGHDGDTPLTHLVLSECAPIAVSLQPPIAGAMRRTTFPACRPKPQGGVFWRFVAAGEFDSKMFQLALCGSKGKVLSEVLVFRPTSHYARTHIRHTTVPACAEATKSSTTKVRTRMHAGWAYPREPSFCRHTVPYTRPCTRATSAPGLALTPSTSALGLGSLLGTSAPAVGPPLPHLRRDWAEGQSKHARLHHGPSGNCSANEAGVRAHEATR